MTDDVVTASLSTNATTSTSGNWNAGSWTITPSSAAGADVADYSVSYAAGTLTVSPALLTVTASNESMTYGGTVPALTYIYTGLVNGDASASFSGALATIATSSSNVGGYSITVGTLAAAGNYTIGTFNAGTLTVNPAPLTITANNAGMIAGQPVPPFSANYSGFVMGKGPSVLVGSLMITTTATTASPAGNYSIVPSGLSSPNYAITYGDGTLDVSAPRSRW